MKQYFENLTEMQKGTVVSIAVHILLLLLFLLWNSGLEMPDSGFAEVGFISASSSHQIYATRPANPPKTQETIQPKASAPETVSQPQEEKVNIPKRRMMEDEEPLLTKRNADKLSPSVENTEQVQNNYQGSDTGKEIAERPEISGTGKDFSLPAGTTENGKDITGPQSDLSGSGSASPFTIEGDASKRQIVFQVIPQYPPGLQKEAVVKIRFTVLPDGRVGSMIPLQKGDPTLEKISMQAMRQWRFNALAAGVQQQNVTGIITFKYRLQ